MDSGSHFLVDYKLGTKMFLNCHQILIFYFFCGVQIFLGVRGFHPSACELKMWWQCLPTFYLCTIGSFHLKEHSHSVIVSVNVGHSQWANIGHFALGWWWKEYLITTVVFLTIPNVTAIPFLHHTFVSIIINVLRVYNTLEWICCTSPHTFLELNSVTMNFKLCA